MSVATPGGGAQPGGGTPDNSPLTTSYTYDAVNNLASTLSPNGSAKDPSNPGGVATSYTYTYDNLLLSTVTPPGSGGYRRETDNAYDGVGQRTSQHTFQVGGSDGGTLTYQYYLDGRLQQSSPRATTPPTASKIFQYDADGNTTIWSTPNASTYYIDGSLRTIDDAGYKSEWTYNGSGQMATLTAARDLVSQVSTEAAHYTNVGQLDQLRSLQFNTGSSGEARTYNADGQVATATQSNGDVLTSSYNNDNTLQSLAVAQGGTTIGNWQYTYDQDYRLVSAAETATGFSSSASYSYWPDGRLGQYRITGQTVVTSVSYDHSGNRTSWTPPFTGTSNTVKSTYNADDTLIQNQNSAGTVAVTYDPSGRMTSDACTTYSYDGFDRVATATAVTSGRPAECGAPPTGSTATTTVYDALDRPDQRNEGTGWWWNHYATMGTEVSVLQLGLPGANGAIGATEHDRVLVNDNAGTPTQLIDLQSSNTAQWLTNNGQGSVGEVTTAAGAATCVLQYDLNGASVSATSATNPCVNGGSQLTELGYQFARRDATTADYIFGKRTYDPSKASFTTPDGFSPGSTSADVSVGSDPLTADLYAYVNGDPVNHIDPNGHRACADDACYVYAVVHPGVVTQPTAITGQWHSYVNEQVTFAQNQAVTFSQNQAIAQYLQSRQTTVFAAARQMASDDTLQAHACGQEYGPCFAEINRADFLPTACPDLLNCIGGAVANHKMDIFLTAVTALVEVVPGVGEAADAGLAARIASEAGGAAGLVRDATAELSATAETAAVHGNSMLSQATNTLYQLSDSEGLLKWGITNNPAGRYSQAFMQGKFLDPIATGSRADMATMERVLTERVGGPLNLEQWAGSQYGNNMELIQLILEGGGG